MIDYHQKHKHGLQEHEEIHKTSKSILVIEFNLCKLIKGTHHPHLHRLNSIYSL